MDDLCIKNGLDLENRPIEVAVKDGKIRLVAKQIDDPAKEIIDLKGEAYISSGWIDAHVHCYEKMTLYYDFPDEVGVKNGVTTIVDAGSTGGNNIGDFYQRTRAAKTNVFALINISEDGIIAQNELADLTKIKPELVKEKIKQYPDFILGIKARMSRSVVGENDVIPLEMAKMIQKDNGYCPLMVHIGSAPPKLSDILDRLDAGDIVTHCFNGKDNGILDKKNQIKKIAWDAYQRGVIFDIGHGTDSFAFKVAKEAYAEGMKSLSISTDIYIRNRQNGPVYNMATVMEKLMLVGYTLSEVVDQVTKAPADYYHMQTKGRLEAGFDADLTCFQVENQSKELVDSDGAKEKTNQVIKPIYTIIGGKTYVNQSK